MEEENFNKEELDLMYIAAAQCNVEQFTSGNFFPQRSTGAKFMKMGSRGTNLFVPKDEKSELKK